MRDLPETRYAKAADGVHIAYQVFGGGSIDLVIVPGFISRVPTDLNEGPPEAAPVRDWPSASPRAYSLILE